ncbi:lysozyme C, milk isozyme [Centropristis striata]|uniref:lysozyme C, milk isozyme n=1 Tax=Centropristis striata TaxID=184440 RepID=UPI0027DF7F9F|nr:lysozyme C, milk isozyme [Centropristis striata]
MRILVVFVLSVLGCHTAEGLNVTKCDLLKAFERVDLSQNIAAKVYSPLPSVICHAEKESGLNTRALNQLTPPDKEVPTTLYGLFQLSNRVVCSDGTSSTLDICGMACKDLVDDNIDDDIDCVLKILKTLLDSKDIWGVPQELQEMIKEIFRMKCRVREANYFSECNEVPKLSQDGLSFSHMSGDL